jgi:hypothetical protein
MAKFSIYLPTDIHGSERCFMKFLNAGRILRGRRRDPGGRRRRQVPRTFRWVEEENLDHKMTAEIVRFAHVLSRRLDAATRQGATAAARLGHRASTDDLKIWHDLFAAAPPARTADVLARLRVISPIVCSNILRGRRRHDFPETHLVGSLCLGIVSAASGECHLVHLRFARLSTGDRPTRVGGSCAPLPLALPPPIPRRSHPLTREFAPEFGPARLVKVERPAAEPRTYDLESRGSAGATMELAGRRPA